jgi:putative oxidoreductase
MMKIDAFTDILALICRVLFGGIFIYASLDKIIQPDQFARIVYNYHLLPSWGVNFFALILPMTELLAGSFLILGLFYTGSRNLLLLLGVVFIFAIGINVARGINLECGCFTVSSGVKKAGILLILRDFAYFLPGVILLFLRNRRWMVDNILFSSSSN